VISAPPDSWYPNSQDESIRLAMSCGGGAAEPTMVWSWYTCQRRSPSQATVFGLFRPGRVW
jgi:hypothetical protein